VLNWVFAILVVGSVLTAAFNGTMADVGNASMASAKSAVELAISLVGQMALWLGFLAVLREAGVMGSLARVLRPLMQRLFPEVPEDHPAIGAMIMNLAATMLGLSNAATPFGLKAIAELNSLNKRPGVATNSMALFLAMNTAGLTLLPLPAIAVRASLGSLSPGAIIVPNLLASSVALATAVLLAKLLERAPFFSVERAPGDGAVEFVSPRPASSAEVQASEMETSSADRTRLSVALAIVLLLCFAMARQLWLGKPGQGWAITRALLSDWVLPLLMTATILVGFARRVKVYEVFVQAAKEGFQVAVTLIPYLVAILVAVGMFRASGALDGLVHAVGPVTRALGFPAEALPMALIRPLSGSGALGVMTEALKTYGPDSFLGQLISVLNGSSETTFYILAVYYGSVQVRSIRHTLAACLVADLFGVVAATVTCRLFFA
jgi:spore maturation protein SpmA